MRKRWAPQMVIACTVVILAAFAVGCGPDEPEYEGTYQPETPQDQPRQWSPQGEQPSQQQAPLPSQTREDAEEQDGTDSATPWPAN